MPTAAGDIGVAAAGNAPGARQRAAAARRGARGQIALILTFGLCVITLLWLILIVAICIERRAAIGHARDEAKNLTAAFQEEVGQTLASVARAMRSIADRMRSAGGVFDVRECAREMPLLVAAAVRCRIIGPDGVARSGSLEDQATPVDLSDLEHFRVHRDGTFQGLFIGQPVVERVSGQSVIEVSRRIEADDGTLLGVMVVSLSPSRLSTLHKSVDLGPAGRLVLVGTRDNVVWARFGGGHETGDFDPGERVQPLPPAIENGAPDWSFIREGAIDHATRLYSTRDIPGFPLRVEVVFDLTPVLAPAAAHARLTGAAGAIATLLLVGLMVVLGMEIRRRTDREVQLGDEQARLAAEIRLGTIVQEQLRASEARLRDFARMSSDWFWEMDADLRFVESKSEGPTFSGAHPSHWGKHPWDLPWQWTGPAMTEEAWQDHRRDLLARRPFRDFRLTRVASDGTPRHISSSGVPVFDEAGRFVGYRGTARDVTAKVEAEAELRRSKEQAEASSVAKSAFLANMSHELRTPLNAIIGFAELIHARKTGRITDDYVEWAGDILSSGRHLLDLINDVLELSRIEAGRYDLSDDTIDLGVIARACLPMVRGQAEKNRVRIDFAVAEKDAVIRADRRAIKQVLLNLLTNAVKFTPAGGTVSIRAERPVTGEVSVIVADTGIGIDPAALTKLCQPFVQADATTSRRYGGTGLGLAISNRLVELHGGTLRIDSAPGQGTKVRVTFPKSRVLAAACQEFAAD